MKKRVKRWWEQTMCKIKGCVAWGNLTPIFPSVCLGVFLIIVLTAGTEEMPVKSETVSSVDLEVLRQALHSEVSPLPEAVETEKKEKADTTSEKPEETTKELPQKLSAVKEGGKYKNGTYQGSAQGFGGKITVSVTIKKGKISSIKVENAPGEGSAYLKKAKGLISTMVKKQTTNVDAVSGATYSSNGLVRAVRNALSKAEESKSDPKKKKGKDKKKNKKSKNKKKKNGKNGGDHESHNGNNGGGNDNKNNENNKDDKKITSEETTAYRPEDSEYKDGTYSVSVICVPDGDEDFDSYTMSMDITIQSNQIINIKNIVIGDKSNQPYVNRAKNKMISAIIKNGSGVGVDAVTGATCSSNAIQEACRKAFEAARKAAGTDEDVMEKEPEATTEKKAETTTEKEPEATTEKKPEATTGEKPETETEASTEEFLYQNGRYKVTAACVAESGDVFASYDITMEVEIEENKIKKIENIVANADTVHEEYWNKARNAMVSAIIKKGTTEGVDIVTGATRASKAIKEACQKAFEAARK